MGAPWLACFIYVGLWTGHEIHVMHRATVKEEERRRRRFCPDETC